MRKLLDEKAETETLELLCDWKLMNLRSNNNEDQDQRPMFKDEDTRWIWEYQG